MKNAIILSCSYNYLLGMHAILNAIEYYGIKADVHIGTHPYLFDYVNYAKTKFSFNIIVHNVTELGGHTQYDDADFVWGKYKITQLIRNDYDGIMYNDCDCMIVNDMTPYLEFGAATDYILITSNVFCGAKFDRILLPHTEEEIENLCLGHTIKNFVCFFNGKTHTDLIDRMWIERDNPRLIANSTLETYFFNRVIHDLGKDKYVVPLPGSLWQADKYQGKYPISMELHGRYKLVNCHSDEIQVNHHRFWNNAFATSSISSIDKIQYPEEYALTSRFVTETLNMWKFLSNYKFTLDEIRGISDAYKNLINTYLGL